MCFLAYSEWILFVFTRERENYRLTSDAALELSVVNAYILSRSEDPLLDTNPYVVGLPHGSAGIGI